MKLKLAVVAETFPIAGTFTIARGSRTEAVVVRCTLWDGENTGQGECVPYAHYGETVESVVAQIQSMACAIASGLDRKALQAAMPAGAARNAVDCALWDIEAKRSGRPAYLAVCANPPVALPTAYTISLAEPAIMGEHARAHSARPLLKIKVGGTGDDIGRLQAVAAGAPNSRIILDANEGWTPDTLHENLLAAAKYGVALVEQPLPAVHEHLLAGISHPVPICADESVHTSDDLKKLVGLYDAVNIKLDKAGGLTEALKLRDEARELGFGVMVGCMVGTSLAMAPAVLLAQGADYVDLDGPLLLARDRVPGLAYTGSLVSPPAPEVWG